MRKVLLIGCLLLGLTACDNWNYQSSVPNTAVQYNVYITRDHPNFVVENGYQTMTVTTRTLQSDYIGYAGLVIWVGVDAQYHAADLCCPNCVKKAYPLEIDGIFAVCPLCGEQYDLSIGGCNPTKGICKEPMKVYSTVTRNSVEGVVLQVHN